MCIFLVVLFFFGGFCVCEDPQRAGNFTLLTSASLRKRRCKLQDSAKLRVDVWSLSEKPRKQKAWAAVFGDLKM